MRCWSLTTGEPGLQNEIRELMKGYDSPREFYVGRLTEGIATLGAAFYPKRVIVRLSDFKSNEYANPVGGERYEPEEENPMLGFRGAGRYVSESFRDCFALECEAMKRVRNDMGLTNVEVMVPFVRTVAQAKAVVEELERQGTEARRERVEDHYDVRNPVERAAGGAVPRVLRWLLDWLERYDAAGAGPRSRLRRRV